MYETILDVDTGVDDALAILLATARPDLNIRAITCVDGNVSLPQVIRNTLKTLDISQAPAIPVAAGARRPLLEDPRDASHVHGADGMADLGIPESRRPVSPLTATELMRDSILASPQPVTIVALGPLTNVALLLHQFPDVRRNLRGVLFMGGSASIGNATAAAEFNVWHDPEATAMVLNAGVETWMYGLDVFNGVTIDEPIAAELQASASPPLRYAGNLLQHRFAGRDLVAPYRGMLGDAGAVCALIDPDAIRWESRPVHVTLHGEGRGQTLVDRRDVMGEDDAHGLRKPWPTVNVALEVDADRYARLFVDTLLAANT